MYLNIDSPASFAEQLAEMPRKPHDYWLILLAEQHQRQLPALISALNESSVPFFGAVFPGVIHGHRSYAEGAVVKRLPCIGEPEVIQLDEAGNHDIEKLPLPDAFGPDKPLLHLFVDCLGPDISGLLLAVFNRYGNKVNYFGGGSGNHVLGDQANVFTADGMYSHSAIVALADTRASTSVRHGWKRYEGPFVASHTDGNVTIELNWEPAMDVYRRSLPAELRDVAPEEFFTKVTPSYPFSISKEGREDVVRDPIRLTPEGELVCVSDVPSNSVMYLVHGDPDQLIAAAGKAMDDVVGRVSDSGRTPGSCLVCDCYTRWSLLGENYERELTRASEALSKIAPDLDVEGALVLGEIASDGEQSLEFYNKTFVASLTDD